MKRLASALATLVLLLATAGALGDGGVFPTIRHEATIPDQQALIRWRDGVETLVIETRFRGTGTDFAWVVPLPATPEVEPASEALFPVLRAMTPPRLRDLEWAPALAVLCGLFTVLVLLARAITSTFLRAFLLVVGGTVVLGAFLIPALGKPRGLESGPGLEVLSSKTVGSYQTTTIAAKDPKEIVDWLGANGFASTATAERAIAQYTKDGWVFVASKLRVDAETGERMSPHPLSFTFPTKQPIYPMRLTAATSSSLKLDLYVIGDEMARCGGMSVASCHGLREQAALGLWDTPQHWFDTGLKYWNHPSLSELAEGAETLTKLTGMFTPEQMSRDLTLYDAAPEVVVERHNAAPHVAGIAWLAANAVFGAMAMRRGLSRLTGRALLAPLGAACAVGVAVFMLTPKVPVEKARKSHPTLLASRIRGVLEVVWLECKDELNAGNPPSLEAIRVRARELAAEAELEGVEGSRPGQYEIVMVDNKPVGRFTNPSGLVHEIQLFE